MQKIAAVVSILIVSALVAFAARAGDAEEIDAINKAAAELDAAFAKDDVGTVKQMMTPGHIAVTPYYDGPQSVADQAASLPDLQYGQTIVGDVSVALLGADSRKALSNRPNHSALLKMDVLAPTIGLRENMTCLVRMTPFATINRFL